MGIIGTHLGMLVAMWIVLVLVGVSTVLNLARSLRNKADFDAMATAVTRPILFEIFPLILLSWLTTIDGTHILLLIWYYLAAALVAIRALMSLTRGLRRI